jgi:hypothetical protein
VFKILDAQLIRPGIQRFVIEAARIARKHWPGQFVILRVSEKGEHIPITIERSDAEAREFPRYDEPRHGLNGKDVAVKGPTLILAMGAGRRPAQAIDEYLATGERK